MKKLTDTIKKIERILCSLENILYEEHNILLNSNKNVDSLKLIEKKTLFKKYFLLNQNRFFFEKEYGIFAPYKNNCQLYDLWKEIVKKCFLLRELNLKNKILINKKFYLNQYFLELFPYYKECITYNIKGDLKN